MKKMDPVHLGEILFEEFLIPMNLSQNKIANDTSIFNSIAPLAGPANYFF